MKVIGLLGLSGSGKDTVAQMIAPRHLIILNGLSADVHTLLRAEAQQAGVEPPEVLPYAPLRPDAVQLAFADSMKAWLHLDTFQFSATQLWGPSSLRNVPDVRYPREGLEALTPREALQTLGTEWGRTCWPDLWLKSTARHIERLSALGFRVAVVSDCRFVNEVDNAYVPFDEIWHITRPAEEGDPEPVHASELEQINELPQLEPFITRHIDNSGTLDELYAAVRQATASLNL